MFINAGLTIVLIVLPRVERAYVMIIAAHFTVLLRAPSSPPSPLSSGGRPSSRATTATVPLRDVRLSLRVFSGPNLAVSHRRGAVGGGTRAGGEGGEGCPDVPGFAFLEIQRDLLKQLESLFVSIADDRCASPLRRKVEPQIAPGGGGGKFCPMVNTD